MEKMQKPLKNFVFQGLFYISGIRNSESEISIIHARRAHPSSMALRATCVFSSSLPISGMKL
jgi:hypothetical protein